MLRPYCYLLFVICYDCARTGLPRRGDQTCGTTLLLFVICYLLWLCPSRRAKMRALVEGEKCFTVVCDSTAIAGRLHCNRLAIPYQSSVPMFHAAWRLILVMQGTLRIGHCLEFTIGIEQTAFLSQPTSLEEATSTDAWPSLFSHTAEGLSAISASHTYHLCDSINSAALREKSVNQGQHWVSI